MYKKRSFQHIRLFLTICPLKKGGGAIIHPPPISKRVNKECIKGKKKNIDPTYDLL
jgi:hypothetical protein